RFRAPRLAAGLVAGAGLGVAGAVLQRLVRNPLASPDIVGITGGASFAAVAVIASGASAAVTPLATLGGGLGAAALLGALAWRGGIHPGRLVLVGLAVQAGLSAAVNLIIVRFPAELASAALQWTTGSLYGRDWTEVGVAGSAILAVLAIACVNHRRLSVLDLGDDAAAALGARPPLARAQLLVVAVLLASLAVALTGPVAFVALAVPHLVRLLGGPPSTGTLALTALYGALLLSASDLVVQHAFAADGLPVGAITATLGAPWLLALLIRQSRSTVRTTS
ncbi:MAG TPA: iron ABC transporter permease, partial [Stackebrandtia sp.]|uniref:FecCD family ABC transporter permease n=1 Tax=Stackebrandtia sp. TaxID=2023065 RepID=UPI002D3DD3DE